MVFRKIFSTQQNIKILILCYTKQKSVTFRFIYKVRVLSFSAAQWHMVDMDFQLF